jgi:plasmid stabilization system protein ParE
LRLSFTPEALAELDEVLTYIADRSPQGAQRVQERLQTIIGFIARHPYAGVKFRKPALRRITAVPYPYLVFYRVEDDEVIIVGVRHAARESSEF